MTKEKNPSLAKGPKSAPQEAATRVKPARARRGSEARAAADNMKGVAQGGETGLSLSDGALSFSVDPGNRSSTAEAILQAALKTFAKNGFDGSSMQEIARLAGVRHTLINYHFGGKEELWCAVMDRLFGELKRYFSALSEVTPDLSALQSLKLICRAFVQVTSRNPERILIVRHELWAGSPRIEWLLQRHVVPVHRFIDSVAERAVAEGSLKRIPAPHFSHILIGAATSFFLARTFIKEVYGIDSQDPEIVATHANWLIDTLFDGLTVKDS